MRSRFCLKWTAALLSGALLYQVVSGSPRIRQLVLDCKVLAIEELGTAAQREQLRDEVGRAAAARDGTTEDFEDTLAFRDAIESQHRLAVRSPKLAASAIGFALQERDESQSK